MTTSDKHVAELEKELRETYRSIVVLTNELDEKRRTIENISPVDTLTRLWNRRYFLERLGEEAQRATRYRSPLSCCASTSTASGAL